MARRRANGEGSIYPRQDGRWEGYVSLPDMDRKFFTGKTHAVVKGKLEAFRKAQKEGQPAKFERKRFADFIDDWLGEMRPAVKAKTWQRYEQLIRVYAKPALGKLNLEKITAQHVQRLYSEMTELGRADRTKLQLHAVLKKAFKQAILWNLVPTSPMLAVIRPKPEHKEMLTLSLEQARVFLAAVRGERYETLFGLAITTGMRQGELLGLRWEDVDLRAGSLRIQRSLQRTKEGFSLTEPKTKKSRRQVVLTAIARDALERHRVSQTAERILKDDYWQRQNLVFTNTTGGPIESSHLLRHCFYPVLQRAGLPKIRFHDLRHTAATLMLGQGVHPKIVSEMLGHSSIAITLDLYSHVTPTMQSQAAAAMDGALRD
jgi:integrase